MTICKQISGQVPTNALLVFGLTVGTAEIEAGGGEIAMAAWDSETWYWASISMAGVDATDIDR